MVKKGQLGRRTNYYATTEAGEEAIRERRDWESSYVAKPLLVGLP